MANYTVYVIYAYSIALMLPASMLILSLIRLKALNRLQKENSLNDPSLRNLR